MQYSGTHVQAVLTEYQKRGMTKGSGEERGNPIKIDTNQINDLINQVSSVLADIEKSDYSRGTEVGRSEKGRRTFKYNAGLATVCIELNSNNTLAIAYLEQI